MDPFTHLFLGSTLVWLIFGAIGMQKEFLPNWGRKASYLIIMLGAIVVDLDVLVPGTHRLITHSLIFPLIALVIGVAFWTTAQPRILALISWGVSIQLALHILLDLGGVAPMGLFWPISPLVYAMGITFVNTGGGFPLLVPWMLVFTPSEWLTWGQAMFLEPQGTIQIGVLILAFVIFLLTVGRDLWPWWKSTSRPKVPTIAE
ncbi:MAG: metal-dependent hydrolase [Candidatus Thorarchaeota archaeon]